MSNDWNSGLRDYGDGWTARHDAGEGWFRLAGPPDDRIIIDGTPADCDLLHACLVALRERPEVLRAALGLGGEARGRTVRAECNGRTYADGSWWVNGAGEGVGGIRPDTANRPQRVVVDLLLPEEPPTVTGRVEVEP